MGTIHNSSLILHPFPLPGACPQAPSWRREARPTTEWGAWVLFIIHHSSFILSPCLVLARKLPPGVGKLALQRNGVCNGMGFAAELPKGVSPAARLEGFQRMYLIANVYVFCAFILMIRW
jgi:hypothetical protein